MLRCPFVVTGLGPAVSPVFLFVALSWILSCVYAVVQYAVLEANAKVSGRGQIWHPHPSNLASLPQPNLMSCKLYYYYVLPGS